MGADGVVIDQRSVDQWERYDLPVPALDVRTWLVQDASIPDLLAARAAVNPDRLAVQFVDGGLTYRELIERVSAVAGWLSGRGVSAGDRVVVVGRNSAEYVIACLAAMWAGAVEVPTNPTLSPRELTHIIDDSDAAVVFSEERCLDSVGGICDGRSTVVASLESGPFSEFFESRPLPPPELDGLVLSTLQYTSGTTGVPKGVELSHANLVAYLRAIHLSWEWSPEDVLVHSLPLCHGHGLNGLYTALLVGASAHILPRSNPAQITDALRSSGASVFYAVPTIWERLLGWRGFSPAAFAGLRLFTSGSSALSPGLSDEIAKRLGQRPLERYGSTETGIVTTNHLDDRVAGSVGFPVPGAEIKVVDSDGADVQDGSIGEIVVRGPSVFSRYWRRDGAQHFLPGGWYRSGDLGVMGDPETGRLRVAGRSKDLIISGGLNVYPVELENVATSFPSVAEAGVAALPSKQWGEEIMIAVVPAEGCSVEPDAFLSWMHTQLAGYKVPKRCVVVEELPRNAAGKIIRDEVAKLWSQ